MSLPAPVIQAITLIVISMLMGAVAVTLSLRSGKPTPAALLVGLTITIGALGALATLL
ncbi:hypothetical protein [Streptosporangium roseum]|uniref:hypothetical protein n=1 Tax=Streptosporangium roseum TaxID=2001 RepID=UPI0012DBD126|nr:hypothetical protein [Streptosporangium roseum]